MGDYQNPFSPTTTIQYTVPSTQYICLKVCNVLGREIVELVNETRQPGTYTVGWDAGGFSSGVYFYGLRTNGYIGTKGMLLVR